MPDVDGETLIKAVEQLADDVPKDPETGFYPPLDRRCADALVELAARSLANDPPELAERSIVVAHVDLSVVPGEEPHAECESGTPYD